MTVKDVLIYLLLIIIVLYSINLIRDVLINGKEQDNKDYIPGVIIGFVTNFFDTLGIGSFAPTTAAMKFGKLSDDRLIPGTLNVAHTIPVILQAYIFISEVSVETLTLVVLLASAVVGSYVGAGFISKLDRIMVQKIMGAALIIVAAIMLTKQLGFIDALATSDAQLAEIKESFTDTTTLGAKNTVVVDNVVYMLANTASEGETPVIVPAGIGLSGYKLVITGLIFLVLGALMTAGVGLYAPAMAVVFISGLSPIVAFPIMMGACAFLMPAAGYRFIKESAYDRKISLGISFGGIFGVILATTLVVNMPMEVLTYIVIVVVTIVGAMMLQEGLANSKK